MRLLTRLQHILAAAPRKPRDDFADRLTKLDGMPSPLPADKIDACWSVGESFGHSTIPAAVCPPSGDGRRN